MDFRMLSNSNGKNLPLSKNREFAKKSYFCFAFRFSKRKDYLCASIFFMKKTPFTDMHIGLGAKMAEFAGFNMPISYTGINDEHMAVRKSAGVFDVSHMGEFVLKGEHALDLIQRVTTNDASKLTAGKEIGRAHV